MKKTANGVEVFVPYGKQLFVRKRICYVAELQL